MKLRIIIFALAFLIFVPVLASADLINPNTHRVQRCIKIVNLDKFSDLTLVGFYTGVGLEKNNIYKAYEVKNNECLTRGYKFNNLNIYWTTKTKFASLNLENLTLKEKKMASDGRGADGKTMYYSVYSPSDLELLAEKVESYDGQVDNANPLIKETLEYSLFKNSRGELGWYKSKRITDYDDGSQQKIETFEITGEIINSSSTLINQPAVKPLKNRGFWRSVFCFLGIRSADNCR